jgi:hypothetical protein
MSATTRGRTRQARIDPTTGAGWRLIFPTDVYVDGSPAQGLIDGAWLFLLLLPAGYWASFARRPDADFPHTARGILGILLTLLVGFAIGPVAYSLAVPPWPEIVGGGAGIVSGVALGQLVRSRSSAARLG